MRRSSYVVLWGLFLTLFSTAASAEQFKAADQYELHFNAFNSTFLTPEVAQAYSIHRSKVRGLLNVAVLDTQRNNAPVRAQVMGQVTNLVGQVQALTFRQVREGEAVYYICEFRFTDDEILNFDLQVQPDANKPAYTLNFKQHFYVD
jgi:hypothetical protein